MFGFHFYILLFDLLLEFFFLLLVFILFYVTSVFFSFCLFVVLACCCVCVCVWVNLCYAIKTRNKVARSALAVVCYTPFPAAFKAFVVVLLFEGMYVVVVVYINSVTAAVVTDESQVAFA